MTDRQSGARFFDDRNVDRGWAAKVTRRLRPIDGLTTLDVTTSERALATFLSALDRAPLLVQHTDTDGDSYTFAWASGYENGGVIRIQGMIEPSRDEPERLL